MVDAFLGLFIWCTYLVFCMTNKSSVTGENKKLFLFCLGNMQQGGKPIFSQYNSPTLNENEQTYVWMSKYYFFFKISYYVTICKTCPSYFVNNNGDCQFFAQADSHWFYLMSLCLCSCDLQSSQSESLLHHKHCIWWGTVWQTSGPNGTNYCKNTDWKTQQNSFFCSTHFIAVFSSVCKGLASTA